MLLLLNAKPATTPLQILIEKGVLSHRSGGKGAKDNQKHYLMADAYRSNLSEAGVLGLTDKELADDWITIHSKSAGWAKYGRSMFSPSLNRLRRMTMDEFYDVDFGS